MMVVKNAFKRMDGKEVYLIENSNKTWTVAIAETKKNKVVLVEKYDFVKKSEAKKAFESHKSVVIDAGEVGNGIDVFLMKSAVGFLTTVVDKTGKEITRKFYKTEKPGRKLFEQYKTNSW